MVLSLTDTMPAAWQPGDGAGDRWPPVRIAVGQELVVTVPAAGSGGVPSAIEQGRPAVLEQVCQSRVPDSRGSGSKAVASPVACSEPCDLARTS
jgi:hypothetical protein